MKHRPLPALAGFSLLEMLIAMALGIIVLAGISMIYVHSKSLYAVQDAMSRLQENGRFAVGLIEHDVRMAGYRGCNSQTLTPLNTLNNPGTFASDYTQGITGFDASGSGWNPTLDSSISGATPAPSTGSDIITIRRVEGSAMAPIAPFMGTTSADLHVDAPNAINQSDILLVSDCSGAAIFQETAASPGTSGSLVHNTGAGAPGNSTKSLGKIFQSDALVQKLVSVTYYIAPSNVVAGEPALWRIVTGSTPEELVPGVAGLQLLYGVDTDADRNANGYVPASSVTDWSSVVSVKLQLLVQSLVDNVTTSPQPYHFNGATITPTDRRQRSVFTVVITLRNRTS